MRYLIHLFHDGPLGESLPQLLSRFETGIPDMYPKAYRWVAEMREIAAFLSEDKAAAIIFEGAAQLYDRLATDIANEGKERCTLDEFVAIKVTTQKHCDV